ncbi:unnamed protein product [Gongylonema pulchrum]|uniref:nicotinate phosphoribosyltransferase n=1 Tax=Gongylonema pulchrum TaxID=637853 RepID=A0A183DUR3_9BILA|nr:unnamed protein product [Gongylonema pulchrum]
MVIVWCNHCLPTYIRKNPFGGEYTVFAGLEDCLHYIKNFQFSKSDIVFLRSVLPGTTNPAFFEYLESLDCSSVTVRAAAEGSIVFPNVPLITVEGPIAVCQLLETTLLTLVNYSSLVATNALRFRSAAGSNVQLFEFGLRRAQGPNGGLSASKYCFLGALV